MEQSGRTYYLNREESKQLLENDFFPVREEWEKRIRFLEEAERTMQPCEPDAQGRVFWRDSTVDEGKIAQLLEQKKQSPYYTERKVAINTIPILSVLSNYVMGSEATTNKELVWA